MVAAFVAANVVTGPPVKPLRQPLLFSGDAGAGPSSLALVSRISVVGVH